jgi:hypothetical protein
VEKPRASSGASTSSSTWRPGTRESLRRADRAGLGRAAAIDCAAFLCSRRPFRTCARAAAAHRQLRRLGRGRAGARGRLLPYYVAKAGVIALTEALALELAPDRILVNAIAPGPILAPDDLDEASAAEVVKGTPLGRWGGEAEIVKAVMLLVETDFITGETIRVDGGTCCKAD